MATGRRGQGLARWTVLCSREIYVRALVWPQQLRRHGVWWFEGQGALAKRAHGAKRLRRAVNTETQPGAKSPHNVRPSRSSSAAESKKQKRQMFTHLRPWRRA